MTLIAFASAQPGPRLDASPYEQLAISLSSRFCTLDAEDVADAIARSLEEIGIAFGADECTLVDYADRTPKIACAWARDDHSPCSDDDLASMPWLVQRLGKNAVVSTTPGMELPLAAAKDREHAERSGISSRLAVPIALGPRVVFGLMIGSRQGRTEWRPPMTERLRLIGEVIGCSLLRIRDGSASHAGSDRAASTSNASVYLQEEARNRAEADQIIGESPSLRLALSRLGQVAPLDATVLLLGETGTGKELFARGLHEKSRRRDRPLVRVNCAALPASLIESELFGHEKGAFTGAISMRQGRFELADGGTIFLDEIGDLVPELQAKLLRVLQEGEFERVGSSKTRAVDVRVIAATHIDLEKAVADGRFRADLYYRLSVYPITLPPLRDRIQDLAQLVWFFIHRHQRELGRRITRVPTDVMQALERHNWPGNVRELENVIERAMICSSDGTLKLDDPLRTVPGARPLPSTSETLDAVQRSHIERVLEECGGRINGVGNAAVRLGLHPNTLRFRIKRLGVVVADRRRVGSPPPSATRPG
jgi:transcriptional regulator with GAF, ATPase, and Fis domain